MEAGFESVLAEDRTQQFMQVLERELQAVRAEKQSFVKDFSESDFDEIVKGWSAKLQRSAKGAQRWGLFVAVKPLDQNCPPN